MLRSSSGFYINLYFFYRENSLFSVYVPFLCICNRRTVKDLHCKTFILDVPGVEYLDDLIEGNYVFKINSADELIENLVEFKPTPYDKNFFFKSLDEELLKSVIDNG